MKSIALKIRVLFEGFFLWFGGLGLFMMLIDIYRTAYGQQAE